MPPKSLDNGPNGLEELSSKEDEGAKGVEELGIEELGIRTGEEDEGEEDEGKGEEDDAGGWGEPTTAGSATPGSTPHTLQGGMMTAGPKRVRAKHSSMRMSRKLMLVTSPWTRPTVEPSCCTPPTTC